MARTLHISRSVLLAAMLAAPTLASAQEGTRFVLQNGRSIPITAVTVSGNNLNVTAAAEGFNPGQTIPLASVDHVYGTKPAGINQGLALLLTGKHEDARRLLTPIVASEKLTAKFPGNYWVEAARALLLAEALRGDATTCNALGKEISDATPEQGTDPFIGLSKALLMPALTTKASDREVALRDLMIESQPADVAAFASYFRGNLLIEEKRKPEALEAYLTSPCLYPSAGLVITAACEIKAADLLLELKRPDESLALATSAARSAPGTVIAEEAKKRLESLKTSNTDASQNTESNQP